ncbi:MAG: rhomboid family intramembrane serine protease [candidate division WOR-3 bacterium]|jgi:membrane associated rhomboid family serine protease|nr:rhomboid family intramembrane serine protease [candidate division WOR-3 bacterium]
MIPLRDEVRSRRRPFLVYTLIALNVLVWLIEFFLYLRSRGGFVDFLYTFGLVPRRLFLYTNWMDVGTVFSSMFLHDAPSPLHVGMNMLFLWVFGDNIEDALGHWWFIPFYLFCGAAGALLHAVTVVGSETVLIGASGAISGILGAYIVLYPRSRIMSLVFLFFFIRLIYIPAWVFIGIWFAYQLLYGLLTLGTGGGGVAFLAHVGGFLAGLSIVLIFRKRLRHRALANVEFY